jgi:hypothetical protein
MRSEGGVTPRVPLAKTIDYPQRPVLLEQIGIDQDYRKDSGQKPRRWPLR